MNGDLENTLNELGPEYRDVVARLRSAREVEPARIGLKDLAPGRACSSSRAFWCRAGYLAAASLFVALGLSIFMQDAAKAPREPYAGAKVYTVAYAPTEEALEIIVASQRADGSWSNDFIEDRVPSRRKVSPLKGSEPAHRRRAQGPRRIRRESPRRGMRAILQPLAIADE